MMSLRLPVLIGILALVGWVTGAISARAQTIIVLNSADDTISLLSGKDYREVSRQPIGREPNHLMLTPDGSSLLIANDRGNELVFLDPATGAIKKRLPGIIDPYQVGFSPDHKWFVTTSLRLDRVDIYDATTFALVKRLAMPTMPSHIAFSADSSRVFITQQGTDKVSAVDLARGTVLWTVAVGPQPAGVIVTPSGQLLAGIMGADYVAVMSPADGHVLSRIQTGKGAHQLVPSPDGKTIYVSNRVANTVTILDAATLKVRGTLTAPGGPDCMEFSQDGRELWVTGRWRAQIDVIDLATGELKHVIPVGRSPHGIYIHKVG
ncbi:MAG TPA: beta-propeller fold lactonase family protein [Stellaceae bacterium]|nr:beta-propeller fold lactonase family protein [Stellaceae bacterium]